jgi:hypothetical protein
MMKEFWNHPALLSAFRRIVELQIAKSVLETMAYSSANHTMTLLSVD